MNVSWRLGGRPKDMMGVYRCLEVVSYTCRDGEMRSKLERAMIDFREVAEERAVFT